MIEGSSHALREVFFTTRNDGGGMLVFRQFSSSCGCTMVERPEPKLAPGATMKVHFQVKPKLESGPQSSIVHISGNDPANPVVELAIRWVCTYPLTLTPSHLDLGWVGGRNIVEEGVEVGTTPSVDPENLQARRSDPAVTFRWAGPSGSVPTTSGNRRRRLLVTLHAEEVMAVRTAIIELKSVDGAIRAEVPLTWKSGPAVSATPSSFFKGKYRAARGRSVSWSLPPKPTKRSGSIAWSWTA